jgi:drug/metabolite transporter (DMT)-like permease
LGQTVPDVAPNSAPSAQSRRWSIVFAGLLLIALTLVVVYTSRSAFSSPLAIVVVAAIGLVALLLQLRIKKNLGSTIQAPLSLNFVGLVFAIGALFADVLHLSSNLMLIAALGAVLCFGISGVVVLHAMRKKRS